MLEKITMGYKNFWFALATDFRKSMISTNPNSKPSSSFFKFLNFLTSCLFWALFYDCARIIQYTLLYGPSTCSIVLSRTMIQNAMINLLCWLWPKSFFSFDFLVWRLCPLSLLSVWNCTFVKFFFENFVTVMLCSKPAWAMHPQLWENFKSIAFFPISTLI